MYVNAYFCVDTIILFWQDAVNARRSTHYRGRPQWRSRLILEATMNVKDSFRFALAVELAFWLGVGDARIVILAGLAVFFACRPAVGR